MKLSKRQLITIECMAAGMEYKQIAPILKCKVVTLRSQMHDLFLELGVANKTQLVAKALREGAIK